jgi:photosystem II stability/assembly factor-like uncharacterized protein
MLVCKYGLIKTDDGGQTWQPLTLITPPTTTDIYAAVIDPNNSNVIYYVTATTFYKTNDGGENWTTKRLPSLALPSLMFINPNNPNIMYMGMTAPAKK